MKKILTTILAVALAGGAWGATGYNGETLPIGPDMSGSVINVTAANAQYVLDGAYGDINGKTINFTESVPDILDLARPTKYEGSGTTGSGSGTTPYSRTLSNVTFTSENGVTLAGFYCHPGHIHGYDDYTKYNYVKDCVVTSVNDGYYRNSILTGITFNGLTINGTTDKTIDVIGSQENLTISGIIFTGCAITNNTNGAVYFNNNGNLEYGSVSFENCNIYGYKIGIYINGVGNAPITLANNYIVAGSSNNNAIQITKKSADGTGSVSVTGNFLKSDKYTVNLNNFEGEQITFTGNVVVAGSRGHLGHFKGDASGNFWAAQGSTPDESGNMTTTLTAPIADTEASAGENEITCTSSFDSAVVDEVAAQKVTFGASGPVINSVQSSNLFGAIKVTGLASNMFVALPFEGFESAGAARKARDAVHPAGLADGTKMYVYDSVNGKYDVFETSEGVWTKATKVTVGADGKVSVDDPDLDRGLGAGSGVIVDRKTTAAAVYVYGQVPSAGSLQIAAGSSLVCAPSTNALAAVDLNALTWEGATAGACNAAGTRLKSIGDVVRFRGPNNKMVNYYYFNGKWGPEYRPSGWNGKAIVPAGTAFWYTAKAAVTMSW